jgi:hypothetical protein
LRERLGAVPMRRLSAGDFYLAEQLQRWLKVANGTTSLKLAKADLVTKLGVVAHEASQRVLGVPQVAKGADNVGVLCIEHCPGRSAPPFVLGSLRPMDSHLRYLR